MIVNEEWFPKIRDNYKEYEDFLQAEKSLLVNPIVLNKEKHKESCAISCDVDAPLPSGPCKLMATVSIADKENFALKIRVEYFHRSPCFRFCSKGRPHMNREAGTGLEQRPIETPHFHKVEEDGVLRAYQPASFANPVERTRVLDLGIGFNLFCDAVTIYSPSKVQITVALNYDYDVMFYTPYDPLADVNFSS